jgi:NitT/TauT family transport system substrate-binding protein
MPTIATSTSQQASDHRVRGEEAMHTRAMRAVAGLTTLALLMVGTVAASAQDKLKVAVGQLEIWSAAIPTLGPKAGIFKKHGIDLDVFGTAGTGETVQAIISGSADIGVNVGAAGVFRAFQRGAPVRVLGANFTGAGDLYWYVRADSPLKSLADATEKNTIAYSTSGSSTHIVVLGYVKELGLKAVPTSTGGQTPTLTSVMSGQIDIGWAAPPFGLREVDEGKIRIIAGGNDFPSIRTQTVRIEVVNADVLRQRRDAVMRFVAAYRETLDWMYSDPAAIRMHAETFNIPEARDREAILKFQPKSARQFDHISDIDGLMADAVRLKFLDRPLSKDEQAEFIQIPPR